MYIRRTFDHFDFLINKEFLSARHKKNIPTIKNGLLMKLIKMGARIEKMFV
jgi:hypothetical protein